MCTPPHAQVEGGLKSLTLNRTRASTASAAHDHRRSTSSTSPSSSSSSSSSVVSTAAAAAATFAESPAGQKRLVAQQTVAVVNPATAGATGAAGVATIAAFGFAALAV